MKVENAAVGTAHVSPRATDAHGHQMCHHPEDDRLVIFWQIRRLNIYTYICMKPNKRASKVQTQI